MVRLGLLVSSATLLFPVLAAASPAIVLGEQSVVAEGLTPAGRAVVFSIGKPPGHLMPVTVRFEEIVEADAAGVAEIELPGPVASRSVWAAVDLQSGEMALAAPDGFSLRQVDFPARGIGQSRRFLRDERRFLEVLLVRPAAGVPAGGDPAAEVGAWGRTYGDGGEGDGDGMGNGVIEAPIERLRPIGDSPLGPPVELRPGDVVVAVDPTTLEIYAAKLVF